MPKYLFEVSYTPAGAAGLMRDGGTKRRAAAAELVESLGGSMETMYFAFGDRDAYAIIDLPNQAAAAQQRVAYTPPGQ